VLLKEGEVAHFVHRYMIEGQHPHQVAAELVAAFEKHCPGGAPAAR
jgi:putative YphP/YqiW family bacilliredoxin